MNVGKGTIMKIFDFHTHAFVDSLAGRALAAISGTSGIEPYTDGTVKDLKRAMNENNIFGAMLLPVATKPSQQTAINNWAADIMGGGIYCCGAIHPDAVDSLNEISRIKSLGLCGVKFHSEFQHFFPDEERMYPIYEKIAQEELFAVFHGGWDPVSEKEVRATPERFAAAVKKFPELTFVIAHLGGMRLWNDVEKYIVGRFGNVYLDVSVIAGHISQGQLLRIIKNHGADKILFGSDCPWTNPAAEIEMIESLPLPDRDKELIFYRNAEKLLGITPSERM